MDYGHLKIISTGLEQVFSEIKKTTELLEKFLGDSNQKELFLKLMEITTSENYDIFFDKDYCTRGHDIVFEISGLFFNCMFKNFVHELTLDASTTRAKMKLKKFNASS